MWILLLLFISLSFSQDEMASEKYCFSSTARSSMAQSRLQAILVPSDKVTKEDTCLVVQMRPHRRELIQRYLLGIYPEAKVDFSSAEIKRDSCKLKVQKVKRSQSSAISGEVTSSPTFESKTLDNNETEDIQIETLNDFALQVDLNEIQGQCKFIRSDLYQITIEVRKNPRPIIPVNLPPGSVVVLEKAPAEQEMLFLKTQFQLRRGEKIELGRIIQELKNKDQNITIKPDLKIETTSKDSLEQVFLSLD